MAIINTDLPEDVSLVRSPLQVKLTSNLQVEPAAFDHVKIAVAGSPTVGQTLRLQYGDIDETFTVQTVSDGTGNTISQPGALSLAEYAALLAEEFSKNYPLFFNFVITAVTEASVEYVKIYPRVGDYEWTVTDGLTNLTANLIDYTNPIAPVNPGVVLLVEIYNPATGTYNDPLPHVLPILSNNEELVFEIQKDFDLRHQLPPTNTIGISGDYLQYCTDNVTQYRTRWAEQQGRPAVVGGMTADAVKYAIFGGNAFLLRYSDFWTFWKTNQRFLTSQPGTREVTIDQPEYLYWVGRTDSPILINIRATATQRSGTVTTYDRGSSTVALGQVVLLKAGYMQLNLPDIPSDPIVSYTVDLRSGGLKISESITYNIIGNCGEFTRYYLFGNSLGGCDTVRATGKFVTSLNITTQQASRIVTAEVLEEGRGQDFDYDRTVRAQYEGSVGYKSLEYILYLQDLLQSPEVWMVDVTRQLFSPIQVDAGTIQLAKDGEDLYSLSFRYRHAWEDDSLGVSGVAQRTIGGTVVVNPR